MAEQLDLLGAPVMRRSAFFPAPGIRRALGRRWGPGPIACVIGCSSILAWRLLHFKDKVGGVKDIQRIAEGLSEAQRRKLLEIGDGRPREFALAPPGFALVRHGLAFVNELGARHLTDEGHAVRNYLKEQGR